MQFPNRTVLPYGWIFTVKNAGFALRTLYLIVLPFAILTDRDTMPA
jgi:hypothetical protein